MTLIETVDTIGVYVHAPDALTESGLLAQLTRASEVRIESSAASANVALLACVEVDDDMVRRIQRTMELGCENVLLVANKVDPDALSRVLDTGAVGLIRSCDASPERLTDATRAAAEGGGSLPPDLLGVLLRSASGGMKRRIAGRRDSLLGDREVAVLSLLAEGFGTHEIAEELHYSERTIKGVVHGIVRRFGLRNRSHAVAFALREGLI